MKAAINKIETFGLVDGPGIRTVIFFQGCHLRCKFCHNPESWEKQKGTTDTDEIIEKILRNKPYFQQNGGVTFSGGEPLLQKDVLIELCKKLKDEKIHIALDTAGIGDGDYKELLEYVDLVLLDVKHITKEGFHNITQTDYQNKFFEFVKQLNQSNTEVWIRQVIIPDENDNIEYTTQLANFIKQNILNVTKIEFLPFHTMAFEKYSERNIKNPYLTKPAMDKVKCEELEKKCIEIYKKEFS